MKDAKARDEHQAALLEYAEAQTLWEAAITRLSNARTAVAWTKGRLQQRKLAPGPGRPRGTPPAEGTQAGQVLQAIAQGITGSAKPLAISTGLDRQRVNVLLGQLRERGFLATGSFGLYTLSESGRRATGEPTGCTWVPCLPSLKSLGSNSTIFST